ncbi:MAG: DUF1015 domain-containing protein [Elusimicrobia bacterium]|nr:DUF1015 domain-containing protein [Elusimicrobiota bacterium]
MVFVRPFRGVRYDPRRVPMGRAVCPPYDVIPAVLAERLRRLPFNAIHLELPSGNGNRYRKAAALWRRWRERGVLQGDPAPSYYVVEQRFSHGGRSYVRTGILGALDLRRSGPESVRRHEKTLSKPKADRLRLLSALRVNTSPIFGLFRDKGRGVRATLAKAKSGRPCAAGRSADGSRFLLWRVEAPRLLGSLERAFAAKSLLIADGHHRFEVAREYFRRNPKPEAAGLLIYLCAEEDAGLLVLPTHRVVAPPQEALRQVRARCRLAPKPGLAALLKALDAHPSPYAFGVYAPAAGFSLAVPRSRGGARSGLCVEWLAAHVTAHADPHHLKYTHEASEAVALARRLEGAALLVKPAGVRQIRRAVERIGLLPQKSTYFYPKVTTGLVFKPLGAV